MIDATASVYYGTKAEIAGEAVNSLLELQNQVVNSKYLQLLYLYQQIPVTWLFFVLLYLFSLLITLIMLVTVVITGVRFWPMEVSYYPLHVDMYH